MHESVGILLKPFVSPFVIGNHYARVPSVLFPKPVAMMRTPARLTSGSSSSRSRSRSRSSSSRLSLPDVTMLSLDVEEVLEEGMDEPMPVAEPALPAGAWETERAMAHLSAVPNRVE